jgi:hypothetical protein
MHGPLLPSYLLEKERTLEQMRSETCCNPTEIVTGYGQPWAGFAESLQKSMSCSVESICMERMITYISAPSPGIQAGRIKQEILRDS